jgi:hypothetical protein
MILLPLWQMIKGYLTWLNRIIFGAEETLFVPFVRSEGAEALTTPTHWITTLPATPATTTAGSTMWRLWQLQQRACRNNGRVSDIGATME